MFFGLRCLRFGRRRRHVCLRRRRFALPRCHFGLRRRLHLFPGIVFSPRLSLGPLPLFSRWLLVSLRDAASVPIGGRRFRVTNVQLRGLCKTLQSLTSPYEVRVYSFLFLLSSFPFFVFLFFLSMFTYRALATYKNVSRLTVKRLNALTSTPSLQSAGVTTSPVL